MEGKNGGTDEFLAACESYCELDVEDPIEVWRLADGAYQGVRSRGREQQMKENEVTNEEERVEPFGIY